MKVTALIPDKLIRDIKTLTRGSTLTESLMVALREWVQLKKVGELNQTVERSPLHFAKGFSARKIRSLNRK